MLEPQFCWKITCFQYSSNIVFEIFFNTGGARIRVGTEWRTWQEAI